MFEIKKPLLITITFTIILTITLSVMIRSAYDYIQIKKEILVEIKKNSDITSTSLQKNLINYIEAYAINEYNNLILNEMGHENILCILVDDYNMGRITGKESYISAKIRDDNWNIIDYQTDNIQHNKKLKNAFFIEKKEILNDKDVLIGHVTIYMSDINLNKKINEIIIQNIVASIILAIILAIFLFSIIHIFILKPLSKITKIIADTDHEGMPKEYIPQDSSKEISLLATVMNKMINSIKKSRQKLREQEEVLIHQAHHDYLTGLPNRILFQDRLEQGLIKADREHSKLALLFIDLDHFKEINDSHGHETGDMLLNIVTQRLKDTIRTKDSLARLGGDEFTVIIEDLTDVQDTSNLAQKILKSLANPITINSHTLYISSSIGISLYPNDGDSVQNLLKYADVAMYKAKDEGRNNFQFYSSEMTELALERVVMETSLREALKNEDFIVYYQAQVNGVDDQIIGMEALVRWKHNSMGLISPAKFIPIAESTGLIVEIDRFVMKTAMKQFSKWYREGLNPGILAMNLAIKQLRQTDFIDMLKGLIQETGCKPEWIELEVTEGQVMKNPEEAIKILKQINDFGIGLAIDDFGTGYSSLSYLKKLPINKLKIDQSFVRDLPDDEEDAAITKAVIALSKSLNLRVIAEGVETKEQKEFMVENGCKEIQGYFYSKPLPVNKMETTLIMKRFDI